MLMLGFSINLMTLFALILSLGLLVDDPTDQSIHSRVFATLRRLLTAAGEITAIGYEEDNEIDDILDEDGYVREHGAEGARRYFKHTIKAYGVAAPEVRALAADLFGLIEGLTRGDDRFLFFNPATPESNYNYNANQRLVEAIAKGCRGAYWDILRRS